jgi:hypothetical protein
MSNMDSIHRQVRITVEEEIIKDLEQIIIERKKKLAELIRGEKKSFSTSTIIDRPDIIVYDPKASNKEKVMAIFQTKNYMLRKRDIYNAFIELENIPESEKQKAIDTVTNTLSMLRTEAYLTNVKSEILDQKFLIKGGLWALTKWVKNGKPLPEYLPKNLIETDKE